MELYCRSPQEIEDDSLIEAHEMLRNSLNIMVNGHCLYVGQRRERIKLALAHLEDCILNGTEPPHRPHNYAFCVVHG